MKYEVKISQSGRGGTIYYLEDTKELPFGWEFSINGVLLFVPSSQTWNVFCDTNDLRQAQNRRDEILKRVAEQVIQQKASGAKYEIDENCISISFS